MSRRSAVCDYTGATGANMSISDVLALDPLRWRIGTKHNGWYVHLHLDSRRGCIERVLTRTGADVSRDLVSHLLGAFVGFPGAVLAGELETGSEQSDVAAAARGFRQVHIFDCIRGEGGRYLGREPYAARYDALWRSQSYACNFGPGLPYELDGGGRAHSRATGEFCRAVPRDWRLTPIVPLLPVGKAAELWEQAEIGTLEGIVACDMAAPISRRRAKRRAKPVSTLDAVCIDFDKSAAVLHWTAGNKLIAVGLRKSIPMRKGAAYELQHESFYADGMPRFARLVRCREDLKSPHPSAAGSHEFKQGAAP